MSLVPKFAKRTWQTRVVSCGLILAVFFLFFHFHVDTSLEKVSYIPAAKIQKDLRCVHGGRPEAAFTATLMNWAPTLYPSFLRVDRKQNLLLWPVVGSQLIRSPPRIHTI